MSSSSTPKFSLFLAARQIWANENGDAKPKQKDYPIVISPALTVADVPVAEAAPVSVEEAMAAPEVSETPRKAVKK